MLQRGFIATRVAVKTIHTVMYAIVADPLPGCLTRNS